MSGLNSSGYDGRKSGRTNMTNSKSIGDIYSQEKVGVYYKMIGKNIEAKSEDDKYLLGILPNNLEGKSVLDIGCGNGRYSELFCKLGAVKVIGLDLSQEMISEARRKKVENNLRQLELIKGDINNMPFTAPKFDLVFSRFSFMYGKDLDSIIAKIERILKDNGEVYALTNVAFIRNPNLFREIGKDPVPLDLVLSGRKLRLLNYARTPEEYRHAFGKANLTLEDEKYFIAVGLSVAPEYKHKSEINFKRLVFKLSKGKKEKKR